MTPEEFIRGPVSHGILCNEDKEVFQSKLNNPSSPSVGSLPDRWNGWKIAEKRQPQQNILPLASPDVTTSNSTDLAVMPSNSVQPVNSNTKRTDRKKKSMSKKLLNGVGDLVICVIQLLD
ncbi:hypothetical protein CEXT_727381 [Caerostris extrusa]|uniref:Uncharacterized protein n=1 Tax=Caerostris extrusa TaxID=172846 RepID=A0AAV4U3J2_CAEEX|nr:hypothetical protein CEXT_727381 [Caerostris extrusa]